MRAPVLCVRQCQKRSDARFQLYQILLDATTVLSLAAPARGASSGQAHGLLTSLIFSNDDDLPGFSPLVLPASLLGFSSPPAPAPQALLFFSAWTLSSQRETDLAESCLIWPARRS